MRVAIDIDGQFKPMTGVQHYVDGLLTGMYEADLGSQISAFAGYIEPNAIPDAIARSPGTFSWTHFPRSSVDAQRLKPVLPAAFRADHVWLAAQVRARQERLMRVIMPGASPEKRIQKYDVIHLSEPGDDPMPYRFWKGVRHVATIHDLATIRFASAFPSFMIDAWRRYFDYAIHDCAHIVAVSEATKRDIVELLKIAPERIQVTPLAPRASTKRMPEGAERSAILAEWHVTSSDGRAPFVLYAGTIEPRKNVERLIRAFAAVRQQDPSLPHRLVLAGGTWNNLDRDLKQLAAKLDIRDWLIFTGYVSNAQLNALMSACTAFTYVSLFEGFGIPPLEAMACGAPVVVSNASSLPEVVGGAAISVDPESVDEIAAGIFRLLTDSQENANRRVLSLARAKNFSWRRTAELTVKAYEAAAAA